MSNLEAAVTIREFCAAAGMSVAKFYRVWRAGELPFSELTPRLGRTPRFPRRDVEAYLRGDRPSAQVFSSRYFARVRRKKEARAQRQAVNE